MSALPSTPPTPSTESVHLLRAGGLLMAGILGGAFGAHAMKAVLDSDGLVAFSTASRYLLFMGCGVMGAAATKRTSGLGWVEFGTVLFSGSIWLLLLFRHWGWPHALLGPITPIGGTLMIAGWVRWTWGVWREVRG